MAISRVDRTSELCALGVAALSRLYRSRELSPVEVVQAVLERIERLNPLLNAYLTVLRESALAAAEAAELQLRAGIDLGPLHGVPVSVKDVIRVRGTCTTAASKILLGAPPDEADASVVRRLRGAGAILLGKANLHEFAFGAPDPEGPFGNVENPRKLGRTAGSSSSGSGSSVAAGLGVVSIGTDTGGSIRNPASLCGIVGLKPTYGLVPVRGVIPVSVNLDNVGPLGRTVADVAAALGAMAGHDPDDPHSAVSAVPDYLQALDRGVRGLRLGIPSNPFFRFGGPETLDAAARARGALVNLGMTPVELDLPRAEETNDLHVSLVGPDLWCYHRRYVDRRELYGRDFRERLEQARGVTGVEYARARDAQKEIRRRWLALFERVDLLVVPANLCGAPPHNQDTVEVDGEAHPVRWVVSRFNRAFSVVRFPSLVVPAGETPEGLPIGLQLVGPPFSEARLLAAGHALERALGNLTLQWGIEPGGD